MRLLFSSRFPTLPSRRCDYVQLERNQCCIVDCIQANQNVLKLYQLGYVLPGSVPIFGDGNQQVMEEADIILRKCIYISVDREWNTIWKKPPSIHPNGIQTPISLSSAVESNSRVTDWALLSPIRSRARSPSLAVCKARLTWFYNNEEVGDQIPVVCTDGSRRRWVYPQLHTTSGEFILLLRIVRAVFGSTGRRTQQYGNDGGGAIPTTQGRGAGATRREVHHGGGGEEQQQRGRRPLAHGGGMVSSQQQQQQQQPRQEPQEEQQEEPQVHLRHHHSRPLYRRVFNYFKQAWTGVKFSLDSELEDLETPPRYRPDSLESLCRATRFTEAELKRIYRGFKAECPTGVVKEDTFKGIYSQFFPKGANTSQYAHYVFNTLDQDHSGLLSFEDFVQGLSVLSRGSLDEKLRWTFSLYDINGDGCITKEEMTDIVSAIYDLMGKFAEPCVDDETVKEKVDRIFQKMDLNKDGVVTLEEFLDCCMRDEDISRSMAVFDSAF
uniref:EF-hand domain-containing protein n=1 Tax=Timema genevievae TaxID=629358 RepID=A0A7R9PJI9_TIMGE|nr:unnamed protein product [Timema genevievae]